MPPPWHEAVLLQRARVRQGGNEGVQLRAQAPHVLCVRGLLGYVLVLEAVEACLAA